MVAVIVFDQAAQHHAATNRQLLRHRGQRGVAHQIKINGNAIRCDLRQRLCKVFVDAVNAVIVAQKFRSDTPLLAAAGNRNRCGAGALAQLGRHRAHTADRGGNHHHIALADFGLLNHAGPGGEPGHTQNRQRQRRPTQRRGHPGQGLRRLIGERLPASVATHDRSRRPVGVITLHDAGNDLPGDHVTGIYAMPHMIARNHRAHVRVERQIQGLTSNLPRRPLTQRPILELEVVGVG